MVDDFNFMMKKKRNAILLACMTMSLNVSAETSVYVVKEGDTLSSILFEKNIAPIYGRRGNLVEILNLNPAIKKQQGHKLYPGMKILLNTGYLAEDIKVQTPQEIPLAPLPDPIIAEFVPVKQEQAKQEQPNQERAPADDFNQSFYWNASPVISWKNLSSKDDNTYRSSQITALSNTNYGINLLYGMHFEERIDIYSQYLIESVSFVEDQTINLLKKNALASRLAFGIVLDKKWNVELAMNEQFFLTSPSYGSVDIKKVTIPELKGSYSKDFYHYKQAALIYTLGASAFLPRTSPDITAKFGYGAGGSLEAKLRNQSFKIGFEENFLKATSNSTNAQNIYWKYIWEML